MAANSISNYKVMIDTFQAVTYYQIKGAIGSLVWLWCEIERELDRSIRVMNLDEKPKTAHGLSRSIDHWSQDVMPQGPECHSHRQLCVRLVGLLQDALTIRNLVCHGLIGISAQHHPTDPEAHLKVKLGNCERVFQWGELQVMFKWMDRAPRLIHDLTDVAMSQDQACWNNVLAKWEIFPEQR